MLEEHIKKLLVDKQCYYIYINCNISTKIKWALTGTVAVVTHSNSVNVTFALKALSLYRKQVWQSLHESISVDEATVSF